MSESQRARKILVIDDEEDVRIYLETLLQDNGYKTISACDGQEGMERVMSDQPGLVILDISMPKKSGMRFYREIRSDPGMASIPVVVVTGVTGYGGDKQALKEFIDSRRSIPSPEGYFSKPIDRVAFLETVNKLMAEQRY